MAEEKILDSEVLNEDALENVAGGAYESWKDRTNFVNLGGGFYSGDNKDGTFSASEVEKAFQKIGEYLGIKIKASLGYDRGNVHNSYYLNDKKISRDELWAIIKEGYAAYKN